VFPVERPAAVRPVTRIENRSDELAVPASVAPPGDDIVEHLLFALKHEGTNLQVIAAACPHLAPQRLLEALLATPTGGYIRKLCRLWERFTGRQLGDLPAGVGGVVVPLFDPALYLVSRSTERDRRWPSDTTRPPPLSRCSSRRMNAGP
jgi:hypothetical protein